MKFLLRLFLFLTLILSFFGITYGEEKCKYIDSKEYNYVDNLFYYPKYKAFIFRVTDIYDSSIIIDGLDKKVYKNAYSLTISNNKENIAFSY